MDMRFFHAVNSTVNGHLLVAWPMGLNAYAWACGSALAPWGVAGVAAGAGALTVAHVASGMIVTGKTVAPPTYFATVALTALAWLLWLVPALVS